MILTNKQEIINNFLGKNSDRSKYALINDNDRFLLVKFNGAYAKNYNVYLNFLVINGGWNGSYNVDQERILGSKSKTKTPISIAGDILISDDYNDVIWICENALKNKSLDFDDNSTPFVKTSKEDAINLFKAIRESIERDAINSLANSKSIDDDEGFCLN